MSEDPYRQLEGGVRCEVCGARMTGDRRAYFRFSAAGVRSWCCGETACLGEFFGSAQPVFELSGRKVTPARWG